MTRGFPRAVQQLKYLSIEVALITNRKWWRWVSCWFSMGLWAVAAYRVDRFWYLLFGKAWGLLRIGLLPIHFVLRPWLGNCEIHYRADIGPGLLILHPGLGVVISAHTTAGTRLTLTGGNCIGGRRRLGADQLVLGNEVTLGANAVILGPVRIGSHVRIGAGAVVVHDAADNEVLVGVPARPISTTDQLAEALVFAEYA